ncbi:oligogalacturonide lyase [Sphingomonas naasensis]|uniref:Oligogalacturonate lyase n=1 Tax=Sphingomonas naasensis TaxID=1344951 RepID=A0A4S1WJX5_9SPHN|nr:oligogalacturonate lyase family protein [Sphingomonas naasensis]NIJ21064.1 oligogalacturonide lyase [Sphingomonas naasensis]TGX43439.1 oligogalacturonate lyase [Sphingomonas naasensis]
MTAGTRRTVLKGLMSGAVAGPALASAAAQTATPQGGPAPREWIDRKTGRRVTRVSPDAGGGKLYFYKNAWTPQGDLMAISTPEGIALVDGKTLRPRLLVKNPKADLMFAARRSREIFYSISDPGEAQPMDRPRTVFAVDVDSGRERRICRIPNGQFNALNADDTLLLGFVAYGSQPLQPDVADPRNRRFDQAEYAANGPDGKPLNFARAKGVRMLQRWAARYPMEIFVVDTRSGARRVLHKTNEWIGHTQFSPTDPQQIIFSHEGPWHRVDRMWAIRADGSGLRKLHQRTMNFEIFGHEWFGPDGKQVFYDLQTPRGQVFWVASVDLASGRRVYRRVERDDWSVHFNTSPDGRLFAGDGGDAEMVAHASDGKWLVLLRPEAVPDADPESDRDELIHTQIMRRERIVDMSAHDYRLEPNVSFSPDGKRVFFVSNMHGKNHVYAVEVGRSIGAA